MPFYVCAFYPKKSAATNGAVPIATCIDVKNAKIAEMKATMLLEESFPDGSDSFFKPKICELAADITERPSVDEFDNSWLECNIWNDGTKTFDHIPTAPKDELSDPLAGARVIFDLPIRERIAYVLMYGAAPAELDAEQLSNAVDILADDEAPEETRAIIEGLAVVPAIKAMYPEKVLGLIDAMRAQMPPFDNAEDVEKFAVRWVAKPDDREQVKINDALPRTYETLDLENALHVLGVNPDEAKASDIRKAKHLIETRDPSWRAWTTSLRVVSGILNIPRGELWELMADGHKNLKLIEDADARRDYVYSKLLGHPLLPDFREEKTQVKMLGAGKFSVEGLAANTASNDGEKTKVATGKPPATEPTLSAVEGIIKDLLTGKTGVASPDEMAKLLTEKELGVLFLIKQLAEDFELSGSDFDHLTADEVHHLTLDVVEFWIAEQAGRVRFITGRVQFYLNERNRPLKTESEAEDPAPETVKGEAKPKISATRSVDVGPRAVEPAPAEPLPDDFKTRAEILEKELAAKTGDAATNLGIWKRVQRTDPARTKQQNTTNAKGEIIRTVTSIRPTYQYMRATELFGPFGLGWGVDIVEERFDRGVPMMEPVLDNTGREIAKKVMRDGDGTIMATQNHTMRIVLWYILGGKRGEITAYGHTKAVYASKYGFTVEEEPSKKSLTDATTKALSNLGFSADVYLGLFDDADYTADNAYEHNLKNASDKAEDEVRLRKELDERFAKNTETMRAAVSAGEVSKIASSLTRTIGSEIKTAKRANDTDHVKYLESRLNRLEEIKADCLKKFEGQKV